MKMPGTFSMGLEQDDVEGGGDVPGECGEVGDIGGEDLDHPARRARSFGGDGHGSIDNGSDGDGGA